MINKNKMRHWFFLSLFVSISSFSFSQEAKDFSMTDTKGKTWNLFKELSQGKTVVLDFFFKDCKPCQRLTPGMVNVFKDYGEDTSKLVILGVSDRDNNSDLEQFDLDFGVNYPTAGTEGGGDTITDLYKGFFAFSGWPMYAVICPNRRIYWNLERDSSFVQVRKLIDSCSLVLSLDPMDKLPYKFYPNPVTNSINISFGSIENREIRLFSVKGEMVREFTNSGLFFTKELVDIANGMYFVQIVSRNQNYTFRIEINKL